MSEIAGRFYSRMGRRLVLVAPFLALGACAPTPEAAQALVLPGRAETQEAPICRPEASLLIPPSAPDCTFARPKLKTLDSNQWARLKIESERRCYQRAERAIRERLRLLQVASRCDGSVLR